MRVQGTRHSPDVTGLPLYPEPGKYRQAIVTVGSIENEWIQHDHPQITVLNSIENCLPDNFAIASLWRPAARS